jgi:hypothetical protein
MYTHAFFTWIVANLLHPLLFCAFGDNLDSAWTMLVEGFFQSCLLSLPSLVMCMVLMYILSRIPGDAGSRFVIWFLCTATMPTINLLIFLVIFDYYRFGADDLEMIVPATMAVVVTVLIRIVHFFRVFSPLDQEKENKSIAYNKSSQ